jgi:two-component system response regulator
MELRTILYAEDSPLDVELTMEALKENNVANPIVSVSNGVEALEYLSCEGIYTGRKPVNPCLILLDLKMPRMDGLEFLSIVKKDIRFKRIPVVMLTSSREEEDLIKTYNLGVNAYIVKPLDFISLVEVVKQIGNFWAIINELPSE